MKILIVNPHIDAEHKIAQKLQSMGVALLFAMDALEAIQMLQLHGSSIDLAIIHREASADDRTGLGLELISKIKKDPIQSELPILLTTENWGDQECAAHQQGPDGVNAYLKFPASASASDDTELFHLIESVMGYSLDSGKDGAKDALSKEALEALNDIHKPSSASFPLQLEEASELLLRPESQIGSMEDSVVLEVPDFAKSTENEADVSLLKPLEDLPASPAAEIPVEVSPRISSEISLEESPEISPETPVDSRSVAHFIIPSSLASENEAVSSSRSPEDLELAQEMPYLSNVGGSHVVRDPSFILAEPLGDAVVPGGVAQSPDLKTLKKYLLLREQDVAILSNQLKAAKDQIKSLEGVLREEKSKNSELNYTVQVQKKKIEDFNVEKKLALDGLRSELEELHFQTKSKNDHVYLMENQIKDAAQEMENLKTRVKSDIRKIRVREKELENRLEMTKKDSEALLAAREGKIIELKRKLDLLEFNMDLLQDQYSKEKQNSTQLRERLARAAQIVRVAGGLLGAQKKNILDQAELDTLDGVSDDLLAKNEAKNEREVS